METTETIRKMPLKDKVAFCSGKDTWNTKAFPRHRIPSVMMSDGPTGLRKQTGPSDSLGLTESEKATCFPVASFLACSFDRELISEMSAAIAEEAGAAGVAMVLAPGVNIKRNPLCGRNFEYFSEDPYLSGQLGTAFITGIETLGIGTSLKHFACNSQEYYRMLSDSMLDERTLREIYLSAFETAVKEGRPASVMCAYNKINGTYCSDNKELLTDILRQEWGFEGFVVTDWGALNDRSKAFEAGCDLVMPGGGAYGEKDAIKNIKNGVLYQRDVNQSAERILRFVDNGKGALQARSFNVDFEMHHELARLVAEDCAVLLKNEGGLLPCETEDIVLIGGMAENMRFQGFGSSRVNPVKTDSLLSLLPGVSYARGYDEAGNTTDGMIREAADLAGAAKTVVIIAGLPDSYEAEGFDRKNMKMPEGQNLLITEVARINPNVVVVLLCGCPVETPWADSVKSILYMGLPGQAGAGALVNLLTGKANPGGRLPETWPMEYEDCPSSSFYSNGMRDAEYREGIYVGYRYYEKAGKPVRFPFGAGLSYTTFSYKDLRVGEAGGNDNRAREAGGNVDQAGERQVRVTVTNTGSRFGGEAVLMFVRAPQDGIHRPVRELKGFEKVFLDPGESKEVTFDLDDRSFAVWDKGWKVFSGDYIIQVGTEEVLYHVDGEIYECAGLLSSASHYEKISGDDESLAEDNEPIPVTKESGRNWYHTLDGEPSREDWIGTLGYEPEGTPIRPFTVNSAVKDVAKKSLLIRLLLKSFEKTAAKTYGVGSVNYRIMMTGAEEAPLRLIQNAMKTKGHFAQAMADFANRKFFRGIGNLLR